MCCVSSLALEVGLPLLTQVCLSRSVLKSPLSGDGIVPSLCDKERREQQNSPKVKTRCPRKQLEDSHSQTGATSVYPVIEKCLQTVHLALLACD